MAREVNGSSQYLTGTAPVTAFPFTLATWIYPDDVTFGTADKYILSVADTGSTSYYASLLVADSTSRLRAGAVSPTSIPQGSRIHENTSATVSTGAWSHIAGVFADTSTITSYLNADGTGSYIAIHTANIQSIDTVSLGALVRSNVVAYYDGRISHAAIWNVALTADEVAALYNNGIGLDPRQVRPDALVAYWPLEADVLDHHRKYHLRESNGPILRVPSPRMKLMPLEKRNIYDLEGVR